jgi:hypothetical protein
MKKLLLLLSFLGTINCYCQIHLGMTKKEAIAELFINSRYTKIETDNISNTVSYQDNEDKELMVAYITFDSNDICGLIQKAYGYNNLNSFIEYLNKKFVKEKEYLWVNYSSVNSYFSIVKSEFFFMMVTSLNPPKN